MKKTYKLLKYIDYASIWLWETFEADENIKLNDWNTIPATRLIKEWYIEEVNHIEEVKYGRPTSRESIWKIKWHYIDSGSYIRWRDVFETSETNRQVWLDREQAEASIALAQITHLLQQYEIPEVASDRFYWWWHHRNYQPHSRKWLLRFDTEDKRNHFYKHHKQLINKLAPFYIF